MPDLHKQLARCFQGRVCLLGLGNPDYGDDGFGIRLAETLRESSWRFCNVRVVEAGNAPERFLGGLADEGCDHLIFLDAVDFGGEPGSVVFLDADEMAARFPQISTHKISLSLLAKWVEASGKTKAWLLGVQPQSLAPNPKFTTPVQKTFELLTILLGEMLSNSEVQSATGNSSFQNVC